MRLVFVASHLPMITVYGTALRVVHLCVEFSFTLLPYLFRRNTCCTATRGNIVLSVICETSALIDDVAVTGLR